VTVEDFLDHCGEDARSVRRVKFKLHDKRAALADLGRHLGLFVDSPFPAAKDTVVPPAETAVRDRQLRRETGRRLAEAYLKNPPLMRPLTLGKKRELNPNKKGRPLPPPSDWTRRLHWADLPDYPSAGDL
jgi:hypothetical protein